jgi:hypothetical protein
MGAVDQLTLLNCAERVPSKPPHLASESTDLWSNKLACRSAEVKKVLTGEGDTLPQLSQSSTTSVRVSDQAEVEEELGVT